MSITAIILHIFIAIIITVLLHNHIIHLYYNVIIHLTILYLFIFTRYLYIAGLPKKENWRIMLATRPFVNVYLLAYSASLVIVVIWVIAVGGFKKRSNAT
jgi:hypothetical protein